MKTELNAELVFDIIVESTNYISADEFKTINLEVIASVADYIAGRVEDKYNRDIQEGEIV